jgi:membrane protease YdiL (CAAX protease family)
VIASIVLFGGLHLYQGAWGILGSMAIGALLMVLYLATGNILAPIIAHALIDLRSLVLIPVIVFRVHTKAAQQS